jgi:integrase
MASLVERKFKSGIVCYIQYWEGGRQKRERAHEPYQIAQ